MDAARQSVGPAQRSVQAGAQKANSYHFVFPEDDQKVHHFHVEAGSYQINTCANCGNPILS